MMRVLVAALVGFHSDQCLSWRRAVNAVAPRVFK